MTPSKAHDAVPAPQSFCEPLGALFSRYPKLFATLLSGSISLGLLLAVADSVQLEGLQALEGGELSGGVFILAVIARVSVASPYPFRR